MKATTKNLSDLGKLLNITPKEPVMQPYPQTLSINARRNVHHAAPKGLATITPADSLHECIMKATSDCMSYTIEEMCDMLQHHVVDTTVVEPAVLGLYNLGLFERFGHAGSVNADQIFTYVQKRGAVLPSPEVIAKTIITFEEGRDLAVWKAMCDRKPRTLDEIAAILIVYGFDRNDVKNRVTQLYKSKTWFDRNPHGREITYAMKKNIPMPTPEVAVARATTARAYTPCVTRHRPAVRSVGAYDIPVRPTQHWVLTADDGINTAIWKVMSDHKPYLASDVAVLLEDIGANPKTVGARMATLSGKGWFDRTPGVRLPETRGATPLTYTLRAGIAMPEGETPYRDRRQMGMFAGEPTTQTPEIPSADAASEVKPGVSVVAAIATILTPTTMQTQATATPEVEVPLVDISVKIKGVLFSVKEAEQLAVDLAKSGYGKGKMVVQSTLVSTSVMIKGIAFTTDEVEKITAQLWDAGFGSNE